MPTEDRIGMPLYLTFLRVDRTKTNDCKRHLKTLPEKTNPGINLYYIANVFGDWDTCVWFEGNNNDNAMNFVQNKLATIPGVTLTYTMPTTPIKDYYKTHRK